MANNTSILGAELYVEAGRAIASLNDFQARLERTNRDIGRIGENQNFGRAVTGQLTDIERQAKKTEGILASALSPENIVKGAAFGAVVKLFGDATSAAFAAEKANRLLAASATEAGLAYSELSKQNEAFAKSASLSTTAAASTTAKIAQLARGSGDSSAGRIADLQKSFLDLSAARGIAPGELENLISTILSGQDEGLNRLGASDPSKLQKIYADSIGKTVEQLSQMEKTLAAVNAVQEIADKFTGANADRLASLSGKAESARANLENLYTQLGQSATGSLEFRDAVGFANDILGSLSINISDVQAKLALGFTPKQIARDEANSFTGRLKEGVQNAGGAILGFPLYFYDAATEGVDTANARYKEAYSGYNRRAVADTESQIVEQVKTDDRQKNAASEQAIINLQKLERDSIQGQIDGIEKAKDKFAELGKIKDLLAAKVFAVTDSDFAKLNKQVDTLAQKLRGDDIERSVATIIKRGGALAELREKRTELEKIKDAIGGEKFEAQTTRIDDYIFNQVKAGRDKIEALTKSALDGFDRLAAGVARENPFVGVLNDASEATKKLRLDVQGLTVDSREWLEALLGRQTELALFTTRLNTMLKANDLRENADRLKNGTPGALPADFQSIVERSTSGKSNPFGGGLTYGQALQLQNGDKPLSPEQNADIFAVEIMNSLSKSGQDPTSANQYLAQVRRNAREGDSGSIQEKLARRLAIVDEIRAKSLNGNSDAELAREISRATDRQIIALTQSLDPAKLTSTQREDAASASIREATRLENSENEAREIERGKTKAIEAIKTDLSRLVSIAEKDGLAGVVRIVDETKNAVSVAIKAPTAADTEKQYQQNLSTRSRKGLSNY